MLRVLLAMLVGGEMLLTSVGSMAMNKIATILDHKPTLGVQHLMPSGRFNSIVLSEADEVVEVEIEVQIGVVTASALNVRDAPNGVVITSLVNSEEVVIHDQVDGWYQVTSNDISGWVSAKYVLQVDGGIQASLAVQDEDMHAPISEGACDPDECWITQETYYTPAPTHIIGNAVMYAPYIMEATADWRGMDLTGFVGGVAMSNAADIGQAVWIRRSGEAWEGPFLVVDVSGQTSVWKHIVVQGQSVEVDFPTAERWGMAIRNGLNGYTILDGGLADVEVWKGLSMPSEAILADQATDYKDFFLRTVEFGGYGDQAGWSLAYAEFTNYQEYQEALVIAESP